MFLPLIGLEVGLVMMVYEALFVHLHTAEQSIPFILYLVQIVFAHSAYGYDRLRDVEEGESDNQKLIDYINNNKKYVETTVASAIIACVSLMTFEQNLWPFIPIYMAGIFKYKELKRAFPVLKPAIVSTLLIASAVVVPTIVLQNDYSILSDWNTLAPPILNLFGTSNMMDVVDTEQDAHNGINTLPVVMGKDMATDISKGATMLGAVGHFLHPNFLAQAPLVVAMAALFQSSSLATIFTPDMESIETRKDFTPKTFNTPNKSRLDGGKKMQDDRLLAGNKRKYIDMSLRRMPFPRPAKFSIGVKAY
jgi:hypothetical protein